MSSSNPPSSNKPNNADAKRKALRTQVEALHAEMEIADYGINEHAGRSKRKVSRHRIKERTIKRLTLEKEYLKDLAVHQTENTTKRLRGSKASFEDEVIKGSLLFGGSETNDGNGQGKGKQYGYLEKQGNENENNSGDEDYADIGCEGSDDEEEEGRYELYNNELHSLPDDNNDSDNDSDNDSNNEEGDETLDENPNANKKRSSRANPNFSPPTDPTHAQKLRRQKSNFQRKKLPGRCIVFGISNHIGWRKNMEMP
jgi:hypothetical protein